MLPCCLDESTDQKCERVFVVGGFIAPHLIQWFEAERLWQKRLEQDGIDYFRSSDCQSVRGPFEKLRRKPEKNALTQSERKKADSVRNDLIKVIVDCGFMGFGFGIFLADYEAVKQRGVEEMRLLGDVPYHLAYQLAMTHAALILHDTDDLKGAVLGFVCDEHEKYSFHAKNTYYELTEKNRVVKENMGSLTYLDDKKSPAVQMADLMAYESMRKADRLLTGRRDDTPEFALMKQVVYKIEMCDKHWLESFITANRRV